MNSAKISKFKKQVGEFLAQLRHRLQEKSPLKYAVECSGVCLNMSQADGIFFCHQLSIFWCKFLGNPNFVSISWKILQFSWHKPMKIQRITLENRWKLWNMKLKFGFQPCINLTKFAGKHLCQDLQTQVPSCPLLLWTKNTRERSIYNLAKNLKCSIL